MFIKRCTREGILCGSTINSLLSKWSICSELKKYLIESKLDECFDDFQRTVKVVAYLFSGDGGHLAKQPFPGSDFRGTFN